ncbi:MAG: hypothetical protein LUD78_00410 [Clostridiales bacterium]|nr:hypothetical protein [Clostridiales bacterium]
MKTYEFGDKNKPVILLLPGTCCHWKATFGEVIPLLGSSFYVVCVSYDGFDETEDTIFPSMIEETEKMESYIQERFDGRMKLFMETVLYCLVYMLLVKAVKGNNPINCLFFSPKPVRDRVYGIGLANERKVSKREKVFYTWFLAALILLLFVFVVPVNRTQDFKTAFLELYLILVVGNWFDGIMIDRFWVSRKSWEIPQAVGIPYVKTWRRIFISRSIGTVVYIPIAAGLAWLFVKLSIRIWQG